MEYMKNWENLLIIESPNKIKTISKYLDDSFKIVATIGHIRDLASYKMGFDLDTLTPNWIIPRKKAKERSKVEIINEIKTLAKQAKNIYLATDPDREGEAISWHVYEILDDSDKPKCKRITYNEITKSSILKAINHPRDIDMKWVESQFARRIIDRLVGFQLSKLVQEKLKADSAGRVQTVALKFIYDRESEIKNFIPQKWWTIDVLLKNDLNIKLYEYNKKIDNITLSDLNNSSEIAFADAISANNIKENLSKQFKVFQVDPAKQINYKPKDPYKTSTLQQDGINKLQWNIDRVVTVAQQLYEGVEIDDDYTALISYPRTDSIRISEEFAANAKEFILNNYGKKYLRTNFEGKKKTKTNNVQDAHEAIRVIDLNIKPEDIKNKVTKEQYQLYSLIWKRTVAYFMASSVYESVTVHFENNANLFKTSLKKQIFDGYRKVYADLDENEDTNEVTIKEALQLNDIVSSKKIDTVEHITEPPARYNQASLIKALDDAGVGRPSTYKSMATIGIKRGYCTLQNKRFFMTEKGNLVIEQLDKFFPYITETQFTKDMEERLDEIANQDVEWKSWIKEFQPKFEKDIRNATKKIDVDPNEYVGRTCPKCGKELIYRYNKKNHSKFIGCIAYPECDYTESLYKPKVLDEICPDCGSNLVIRLNKRGKPFIGCSSFPKCKYIKKVK